MPVSPQENCAILKELVSLRAQKASLLGFQTHADYVLEMNMAKTSQTVATFLGSTPGVASQPCPAHSLQGPVPAHRHISVQRLPCSCPCWPVLGLWGVSADLVCRLGVLPSFLGTWVVRVMVPPLQMSWRRS